MKNSWEQKTWEYDLAAYDRATHVIERFGNIAHTKFWQEAIKKLEAKYGNKISKALTGRLERELADADSRVD